MGSSRRLVVYSSDDFWNLEFREVESIIAVVRRG
jgi:hypothetical protein